ncbi:PREDICTED: putative defense protein Hdd11 [Amphimedon queenslandica]|uniref:Reelin domain-containing protein n=1 Tax=Amphimedon queenslandica TaxID=400682 RepID=A0AAN0J3N9_AMPQE|nr:PREDICTED: putative defense protein Hdd11 [Amphimedon queenslandica]|eukprot:XP_019851650.1 PREDICTED: putative defense protein Hdd11 [Amphimedon queenslandica]
MLLYCVLPSIQFITILNLAAPFTYFVHPVAFLLQLSFFLAHSYSSGPPAGVCSSLVPGHSSSTGGPNPGGFYIFSDLIDNGGDYNASQSYTIRLAGSRQFKGLMIQAREAGTTNLIGSFSNLPSGTKTLTCGSSSSATVTHSDSSLKNSVTVTWTAPDTAGMLEIRYTVVIRNDGSSIFYANMNAGDFRPGSTEICPMTDKVSSINPYNILYTYLSNYLSADMYLIYLNKSPGVYFLKWYLDLQKNFLNKINLGPRVGLELLTLHIRLQELKGSIYKASELFLAYV